LLSEIEFHVQMRGTWWGTGKFIISSEDAQLKRTN
jgi:hypothetical protein